MMFSIIDVDEKYYSTVHSLAHKIWPHTFAKILSKDQIAYMLEWMYSISSIKEQIEKKGNHFILLRKGEDYIGYAAYEFNYDNSGNAKLHKIYVLPEQHGTGAGKFLMKEVIQRASRANCKNLLLNVNRDNPAIGFYKKTGFEIIKTEDIDIGNGFYMNDYVMRLQIEGF